MFPYLVVTLIDERNIANNGIDIITTENIERTNQILGFSVEIYSTSY